MDDTGYTIEYPLWGARLPGRRPGLDGAMRLTDSVIYQPTWVQWDLMESRHLIDEYAAREVMTERLGDTPHSQPPVCLLRLSPGGAEPDLAAHDQAVRHTVDALRLYAPGGFLSPDETGTFIEHPGGLLHSRVTRIFRAAAYGYRPAHPYELYEDDLASVTAIEYWCAVVGTGGAHANAAVAIENFRLSFGATVSLGEQALHRFIALEAMLGTLHDVKAGASFAVRAANAAFAEAPDAAAWLGGAAALRNTLAHNLPAASPSHPDLDILETIVRCALMSYFAFLERDVGGNPLRGFNKALAAGPILEDR